MGLCMDRRQRRKGRGVMTIGYKWRGEVGRTWRWMVLRVLEGLLLSMDEGLTIIKGVIRDHILLQIAVFGLEIRFIYSS